MAVECWSSSRGTDNLIIPIVLSSDEQNDGAEPAKVILIMKAGVCVIWMVRILCSVTVNIAYAVCSYAVGC